MGKVIYITNYSGGRVMNKLNKANVVTNERKNEIAERAKRVLEEYELKVPIDPVILAAKVNIGVYKAIFKILDGKRVLGAITREENNVHKIIVDKRDHINRQRFTIAHELGHYFLEHMNSKKELVTYLYRGSEEKNSITEKEADYFASCILMDENAVREGYKLFKELGYSKEGILGTLAQDFKVSKIAMEIRVKELALAD